MMDPVALGAERSDHARSSLDRVLNPGSVAIVGVSDESAFVSGPKASLSSDAEFFFVHPRVSSVCGHDTYPDLRSVGRPVDAIFSAVGAKRTVDIVEQAAELGAGGVISFAGGFAEMGESGRPLQDRMLAAARKGSLSLIGPNGVGMINVPRGLHLSMLTNFDRRAGGLSVASHSGAMIEAIGAAAHRPGGVGLNLLISAGNEAVTDLADYLEYFAHDPLTRVVALAVEKVRRPEAFFQAAAACLEAGKPIVALKLGRSERAQRMAASHTGTLTGDTWVYDVAFKQAGIQIAHDIDDLIDRVQFFEQLPRRRWSPVRGLAVLTATGGFAQLSSDLASAENVDVPEIDRLKPFVEENVPGGTITNPLDATGFVFYDGGWDKIVTEYANAPEIDAVLYPSQHADWDRHTEPHADAFADAVQSIDKASIIAPCAGAAGEWLEKYRAQDIAVGNGLRGCMRGLSTMASFMRLRPDTRVQPATEVEVLEVPDSERFQAAEGEMLSFSATMELLSEAGIPVLDYELIEADAEPALPRFAGPYVVKLADVAHRTEHGAVRVGVQPDDFTNAVADMRKIATSAGLPARVVAQPMVSGIGEVFIGVQGGSELGPVVAFGLGGIFIEVMKRVSGRMAPMSNADAGELLEEFRDLGVLDGFRGAPPWNREAISSALVGASRLAAAGRGWIESIDINPLIVTAEGIVAVDGLCLVRSDPRPELA